MMDLKWKILDGSGVKGVIPNSLDYIFCGDNRGESDGRRGHAFCVEPRKFPSCTQSAVTVSLKVAVGNQIVVCNLNQVTLPTRRNSLLKMIIMDITQLWHLFLNLYFVVGSIRFIFGNGVTYSMNSDLQMKILMCLFLMFVRVSLGVREGSPGGT